MFFSKNHVKKALSARGISCRFDVSTGEFRVNVKNGKEATAYYTDDALDALQTGIEMSEHLDQQTKH